MAIQLNSNQDCCESSCTNTTVNVPGPEGAAGAAGTNGTNGVDGVNAYSSTTVEITVPDVNGTLNMYVADHAAFSVNQIVVISGIGHYRIIHKGTDGSGSEYLGIIRLSYPDDSGSTGATITIGTEVSPAGPQGPAGGGTDQLAAKGDLLTRTNTAIESLSVSGNGTTLFSDSTAPTGLEWRNINFTDVNGKINLGTQTDAKLPLDRLTGPSDATGDLAYFNGTVWARLPMGADGRILTVNGGVPAWLVPVSPAAARVALIYDEASNTVTTDSGAVNIGTVSWSNGSGGGTTVTPTITVNFIIPVDTSLPVFIQDTTDFSGTTDSPFTWRITNRSTSQIVFTSTAQQNNVNRLVSLVIFN